MKTKELNVSVLEVLKRARGLVAKGWCKGGYCRPYPEGDGYTFKLVPRYCAAGALRAVTGCYGYQDAGTVLYAAIGNPIGGIPGWNDRPERTHTEVLAAFDRAISMAEIDQELSGAIKDVKEEHADRELVTA